MVIRFRGFQSAALLTALLATSPTNVFADDSSGRGAAAQSAGFATERLDKIRPMLQRYVDEGSIAGAVTLVMRDGVVVHQSAVGWADKEGRKPMREDTLFRIASQTKALTSVAVLQLVEEGKLSLTMPVSKIIPSFAKSTVAITENGQTSTVPAKREITIRDLLTHTAGISYGTQASIAAQYEAKGLGPAAGSGWYFADKNEPVCDSMERLGTLPFVAQPGEAFVYGYNTDVLGCVVERISGQSLDHFLKSRIIDPLGMSDTFFYVPANKRDRLAVVYSNVDGKAVRATGGAKGQGSYTEGPRRAFSGGAGLVSTAKDYARFLEMIRRNGEIDGKRILSPRSVALMRTNQIGTLHSPDGLGFGYGFQTTERYGANGMETPGSFGWGGAYGSNYRVDPQERLVTVFMIQMLPLQNDVRERFSAMLYQSLLEPATKL
ncbi:MAG TPA: serine hydrolase domain-containing protein [Steroidobacteraceae bacterium]|nr:serine hydrolase domain-containing protein [Steroidobacteraceae bacterium]